MSPGRLEELKSWLGKLFSPDRPVGSRGEALAAEHLRSLGYQIIAQNLKNRSGEIDILATAPDGRTVVFVEVKTAEKSHPYRQPEFRVGREKQKRIVKLAAQIARQYHLTDRPIRFDVIGITLPKDGAPEIRHHPGAFESHV